MLTSPAREFLFVVGVALFSPWVGSGKILLMHSRRSWDQDQVALLEAQARTSPSRTEARCKEEETMPIKEAQAEPMELDDDTP